MMQRNRAKIKLTTLQMYKDYSLNIEYVEHVYDWDTFLRPHGRTMKGISKPLEYLIQLDNDGNVNSCAIVHN